MTTNTRFARRRVERLQKEAQTATYRRVEVRVLTEQGYQLISVTAWTEGAWRYRWRQGLTVITKSEAAKVFETSYNLMEGK